MSWPAWPSRSRGSASTGDKVHKIGTKVRGTLFDQIGVKTCGLVEEDKAKGDPEVRQADRRHRERGSVHEPRVDGLLYRAFHVEDAQCDHLLAPPAYGAGDLYDGGAHPQGARESRRAGGSGPVHPPHGDEKTQELMANCDYAVATGGAALVKVVYTAGVPAQTVGAGNVVSIVDSTVKDIPGVALRLRKSKTANNAASCSSENAIAIEECIFDKVIAALKAEGGYLCSTEEREMLRRTMWLTGHTKLSCIHK